MMPALTAYAIRATYEELLLLDGKCSDEVQKIIDAAKTEHSIGFELPFMNEALRKAQETGKLEWAFPMIRHCSFCDKKRGYHKYPRSSRYHHKGQDNADKPLYYSGVRFNPGIVQIQGVGDICYECFKKLRVLERLIDYILDNDLRIEIQKNDFKPTRYIKDPVKICFQCEKEMRESQMGRVSTVMRDGTYPGKCPHCGAIQQWLGKQHKHTDKFVMVNVRADELLSTSSI